MSDERQKIKEKLVNSLKNAASKEGPERFGSLRELAAKVGVWASTEDTCEREFIIREFSGMLDRTSGLNSLDVEYLKKVAKRSCGL